MKEDNYFWNYKYKPGITRKKSKNDYSDVKPLVSIITSYYNRYEYMWQTINCILNQTFQSWEWIIVDDGSTDKKALEYLKAVEKIDNRIRVYHKENGGLATGRDYAIKYATTKYILPLDADDLIEPTYIETLFWTLETNPESAWAFTNSVGFGKYNYLSDCDFDCERMKTDNHITATALIRKDKILNVGGYGKAKRYVNEDWHLWLRMLANKDFPIQVSYYGFWYRRQEKSLLTEVNDPKKEKYKLKMRDLKEEADKITEEIKAKIYPQENNKKMEDNNFIIKDDICLLSSNNKSAQLYILPYLGTDKKMYRKIKKQAQKNDIYIVTLQRSLHSQYMLRQKYEQFSIIYDLNTFLESKYWISFLKYIKDNRNIKDIYLSNTIYNREIKEKFEVVDIENCDDSNFKYELNVLKYYIKKSIIVRGLRKILRIIIRKEC